jgi:hypothetical protein
MSMCGKSTALLIAGAAAVLLLLASCSPASAPEPTGVQEHAAPQEQAAEQGTPTAALNIQAESRLKEPAAAAPRGFSLEQANPFPPPDIIQSVGYYGGAEPGYCDLMSVDLQPLEIEACPADTVEQMDLLALMLTGLENRETISLTITYPDSSQITQTVSASPGGTIRYEFTPDLVDSPGDYRFTFQTGEGVLEKEVAVTRPDRPQLYLLPELRQLALFNFVPGEDVRLFLYQEKPDLGLVMRAWQEYKVDAQGSLTLDYPPLEAPYFYAIGEASGLVPYKEKGASSLRQMWPGGDIACPGAPRPLPLSFDSTVSVTSQRVVAEVESYPQVFSFPIPIGTKLKLEEFWGSPRCQDHMIWWTVECPRLPGLDCQDFTRVWIPEGRRATYYIQPMHP